MGVEGQVVARDREPGFQRDAEALRHRLAQGARVEVPEQPVMRDEHPRPGGDGALDQLEMR
jgi:hypothetical protein